MTTRSADAGSDREVLAAARLLLARMGVDPADLAVAPAERVPLPTFAAYIPVVAGAVTAGTRRAYNSYWDTPRTTASAPTRR